MNPHHLPGFNESQTNNWALLFWLRLSLIFTCASESKAAPRHGEKDYGPLTKTSRAGSGACPPFVTVGALAIGDLDPTATVAAGGLLPNSGLQIGMLKGSHDGSPVNIGCTTLTKFICPFDSKQENLKRLGVLQGMTEDQCYFKELLSYHIFCFKHKQRR